jgi:hypothetical protein
MKKVKRRKHKPERKQLDDKCMEYLKLIVRLRDKGCVTPGRSCGGYLTASHWQGRSAKHTRYDLRNVNCQCSNCNGRHNHYKSYYDAFMLKKYGLAACIELADKAQETFWIWSIPDLRDICEELKTILSTLENAEETK